MGWFPHLTGLPRTLYFFYKQFNIVNSQKHQNSTNNTIYKPVKKLTSSTHGDFRHKKQIPLLLTIPQEILLEIFKLANFTGYDVLHFGFSSRAYWEMTKRSDQVWSYFLRVDFVFYTQVKENQYTSDASFISKEKIEIITKQHETCYMSKLHSIHSLPENVLENIKSFVDVYGVPYSVINREIIQISPDLYEPLPKWIIKWSETKTLSREDYDNGMKELFEQFDCKASDFQDELIKLYESLPKGVTDEAVSYHVYRLIYHVVTRSIPPGSTTIDVQLFPIKEVIKSVRKYYRMLTKFMPCTLDGRLGNQDRPKQKQTNSQFDPYMELSLKVVQFIGYSLLTTPKTAIFR